MDWACLRLILLLCHVGHIESRFGRGALFACIEPDGAKTNKHMGAPVHASQKSRFFLRREYRNPARPVSLASLHENTNNAAALRFQRVCYAASFHPTFLHENSNSSLALNTIRLRYTLSTRKKCMFEPGASVTWLLPCFMSSEYCILVLLQHP